MGRTHGVHAEPTTFGLKLAGWAFALERDRERLERALEGLRVGKLSGAVGQYAAIDPEVERIACERLGLEPAPSSTQILQRDRHAELLAALALLASSLERFATEIRHLARTEVREVEEPFGARPEGLVGDAAQAEPDRRRADLRARARRAGKRARRARERRALARARHLALVRRARRAARLVPRDRLHARPLRVAASRGSSCDPSGCARTSTRATGSSSASACFSRSSRAGSCAGRGLPASSSGTRCAPGTRSSTSASSLAADAEMAASRRPRRRVHARGVHRARRHRVRPPAALVATREAPVACLRRCTSASGKVRELYALGDDRLLLVATDRISTFDVVLPDGDPRQGARADRPVGVLVRADAAHRPQPSPRAARRRPLARVPAARDAPRRRSSSAATSPAPGWTDYRESGRGLRAPAARRAARVGAAAGADRDAGDEGDGGPRPQHHRGRGRGALRREASTRAAREAALALYRFAAEHAETRGILLADTKFEFGVDATAP